MRHRYYTLLIFWSLMACASTTVYTRYVIDPVNDKLLAHETKDDLPLKNTCSADSHDKGKCIGMMTEDFYKMEEELLILRQQLKDCQSGPNPLVEK